MFCQIFEFFQLKIEKKIIKVKFFPQKVPPDTQNAACNPAQSFFATNPNFSAESPKISLQPSEIFSLKSEIYLNVSRKKNAFGFLRTHRMQF